MPHFVPRERKHKRLARQALAPADTSNAKGSRQKRKRLEKYLETKLRKDENTELIRKLADQKVDTSLLRSSKKLGRVHESKRERLQRALKERDVLGLDPESESVLFEARQHDVPVEEVSDYDDDEEEEEEEEDDDATGAVPEQNIQDAATPSFGGGLKRPLEVDESGQPVLRKRKRRKQAHLRTKTIDERLESVNVYSSADLSSEDEAGEEWLGFSDHLSNEHSSEDELSEASVDDVPSSHENAPRISAFKAWADSQRNAAIGFTPSAPSNDHEADAKVRENFRPRAPSPDPLLEKFSQSVQTSSSNTSAAIAIQRAEEVQSARLELPVVQEEQKIIETVNSNPVTIVCGATGSGKTTQVPQMLFENGYGSLIGRSTEKPNLQGKGMIGITQPRRVAATSVADRVAYELGPEHKNSVAHQVRYDTNVSRNTAIKFMTDGILLREIQSDFPLSKYSCIILDEAHERTVNTDILIGMLSRIVPLRAQLAVEEPDKFCPLKLIIMSATLRVNDFLRNERLFLSIQPPVLEIEGRQYSVTEHFARKTKRDYVNDVIEKVARGHCKLPQGGMLVFLTGQQEILTVERQLRATLQGSKPYWKADVRNGRAADDFEDEVLDTGNHSEYLEGEEAVEGSDSDAEVNVDAELDGDFSVQEDDSSIPRSRGVLKPHILPLYAALPASQQQKVFQPPPEGHRLIILATNVAETSLTIPGIRYVFDAGRSKEKCYDQRTGIQTFEVDWISKASAEQRKGRAGRTGPGGHVWRVYSSAVYERYFDEHTVPEILRTPLESVVLQLKGLEIERVANFPFPTAPQSEQLVNAEKMLTNLGAINGEKITEIGKEIVKFPVSPRFGRMLVLAKKNNVLLHTAALVAGLAVGDLHIPEAQFAPPSGYDSNEELDEEETKSRHQAYTRAQSSLSRWDDQADAIKLLMTVAVHAEAQSKGSGVASKLCKDFWLREKAMQEVQQLRQQLQSILHSQESAHVFDGKSLLLPLTTEKERTCLKQIVAAGFIDQLAIRADSLKDEAISFGSKPRRAIEVAYRTLIPTVSDADMEHDATPEEREIRRSVFVHPSSVLAKLSPKEMPQYIVYSHLSRAPPTAVDGREKRTRMHPLTAIGPKAIAVLAEGSPLLEIGKPVAKIEELPGRRRQCWVGISLRAPDVGGIGWPLGAWKVIQKKGVKSDWVVEKVLAR